MTKEKALRLLKNTQTQMVYLHKSDALYDSDELEALNMAISALERQNTTTEKMGKWLIDKVNYENYEPSTFAWFAYCHCSECGQKERFQQCFYNKDLRQIKAFVDVTHTWGYEKGEKYILFRIYNKCPCCGADMENEVTEEIDKEKIERIKQGNLRQKTLDIRYVD